MRFRDVPQYVRDGGYQVDIPLDMLIDTINRFTDSYCLQMQPDFQRAHVWTDEQSSRYVEFLLRGGRSSRIIYFNHPGWQDSYEGEFVLVDGLQRVNACLRFLRNELTIFHGQYFGDFTDTLPPLQGLKFNINSLKTRAEVLQWYLDLNEGGVVHTTDELDRVRAMLEAEKGT